MRLWTTAIALAVLSGSISAAAAQEPETVVQQTAIQYPEPPPIIEAGIIDDRFEPGNFEYLRGAFPQASDDEKSEYAAVEAWSKQCSEEGNARQDEALAELGLTIETKNDSAAADLCRQVPLKSSFDSFETFAELSEATVGARLVFNTLIQTIPVAYQRIGLEDQNDLGERLRLTTLEEQLLRNAFKWGRNEQTDMRVPAMTDGEREVFLALLSSETMRIDHQNTQWIKGIVNEQGWPTISDVGRRGASAAWLLVQHSDLDPVFQYRALGLMEPLVAEGEVSKSNYAYLYDRIMLKLNGKQRYATQITCENGVYVPQPLEDPARMEELRAEMDLVPFAEYLTRFSSGC